MCGEMETGERMRLPKGWPKLTKQQVRELQRMAREALREGAGPLVVYRERPEGRRGVGYPEPGGRVISARPTEK